MKTHLQSLSQMQHSQISNEKPRASVSISCFVSLPWSGGAFWALLRPTSEIFAIPPQAPEVTVPSAQWNGGTPCSFCPYFNSSNSCILGGWPLCLEWASIGTAIAPQGSL